MPKETKHLRLKLPLAPDSVPRELKSYIDSLVNLLQGFFDDVEFVLVDKNLDGSRVIQNVTATFTIDPLAFFVDMYATGAVSSHATTAIKNGRKDQRVVLSNMSSFNITIVNAANTALNGSANAVLTPNGTLTLRWTGSIWIELGRSIP